MEDTQKETDKFMVRMPTDLHQKIKISAAQNRRSMNAEVVFHLSEAFEKKEKGEATAS